MKNSEIERKYILSRFPKDPKDMRKIMMEQAYISFDPVIRIRKEISDNSEDYILTYKGPGLIKRTEFNIPIDAESFDKLLDRVLGKVIKKTRYLYNIPGTSYIAEMDEFHGEFEGLLTAEVEFESMKEFEQFKAPDFFGRDITKCPEYKNSALAKDGLKYL